MPMISEATPIAFADPLPDSVDVVVIGAGVVGTTTSYFLARRGVRVLLCEKGRVAGEQSSRNWGLGPAAGARLRGTPHHDGVQPHLAWAGGGER